MTSSNPTNRISFIALSSLVELKTFQHFRGVCVCVNEHYVVYVLFFFSPAAFAKEVNLLIE